MGNFHYEDRVVWDEIAPPLQEMLKHAMTSLETLDKLIPVTDNLVKLGNTTVTNNLLKIGNTTVTNNLLVLGDTTVTNHLKSLSDNYTAINNLVPVSANLVKLGNTTVTNNLLQLSDTTLTNNLKKLGDTTVTNNLTQLGNTTVTNNLKSLSNNYSALNSLVPVAGNLTQLGNNTVTNNLKSLSNNYSALNNLVPVSNNLVQLGNNTVTNNLKSLSNNYTAINSLVPVASNLVQLGDTNVTNNLKSLSNNYSTLNSLVPVASNLVQLGDTTLTNNLKKLGDTTVTNNLLSLSNNYSTLNSLVPVASNLVQLGDTTLTNNLKKLGNTTVTDNLVKLGDTTVTNNLKSLSSNYSALNSLVPVAGNLTQLGNSTVTNNLKSLSNNYTAINSLVPVASNLVQLGDTTITNNLKKLGDTNVTNNLTYLSDNKTTITNIVNKAGDIINITNIFGGTGSGSGGVMDSWTGDPGKVAKTNSKGQLICDDLVYTVRAAGNAGDVNFLKGIPLSIRDIFYSWDRISHNPVIGASKSAQNLLSPEHLEARAAYDFIESKGLIRCNRNSDAWTCFLSNSIYDTNYKIVYAIDTQERPSGDDDILVFVLGYMVDKNGCFHTIQVQRWGDIDDGQHNNRFAITYDIYTAFFTTTPVNVLARAEESELIASNFNKKYCYLEVEKTTTSITAKTSQIVDWSTVSFDSNRNPTNPPPFVKTLTWTLPSTKPANWPQEMYDNIKQMMQNPSKIGFGTESNECCFAVYQDKCVNIMDKTEIFDLASGKIRVYDKNGNETGSRAIGDEIQPNSIIYSSLNKRLFYYRKDNNFIEMFTGG